MIEKGKIVFDNNGNKYLVGKEISKGGAFGRVFEISKNDKKYALKALHERFELQDIIAIKNEYNSIKNLKHDNIIEYYYFHGEKPFYLIMELAESSLRDFIDENKKSNITLGYGILKEIFFYRFLGPFQMILQPGIFQPITIHACTLLFLYWT